MNVWLVFYYNYEETYFRGVFSTKELAEAYVEKQRSNKDPWFRFQYPHDNNWDVEEWTVDSEG